MTANQRKQITSVTLATETHEEIKRLAQNEGRSVSSQIDQLCRRAIESGKRVDVTNVESVMRAAGGEESFVARVVAVLRAAQ